MERISIGDYAVPRVPVADDEQPTASAEPTCPGCGGYGRYKLAVPYWHTNFAREFPCECRIQQLEIKHRAVLLRRSNLADYTDKTLETFDPEVPGVAQALARARRYAREPRGALVLAGPVGIGKTHLAAAIAWTQVGQRTVYMATVPDLLDELRATFNRGSEATFEQRWAELCAVDLLILDEAGVENATDWSRERLYMLINDRYKGNKRLILTTNQGEAELGRRLWSRLDDRRWSGGVVHWAAADYRRGAA